VVDMPRGWAKRWIAARRRLSSSSEQGLLRVMWARAGRSFFASHRLMRLSVSPAYRRGFPPIDEMRLRHGFGTRCLFNP